jgi:hypothetical protein
MVNISIIVIMAICAGVQFQKGSLVKSFGTFISALCASFISLWWYEQLAEIVIKQEILVDWATTVSFGMLFLISFAVLQSAAMALTKQKIDFGFVPERIGRVVFGLLLGYIIAGAILLGAEMGPLSANLPYERFNSSRPDPQNPGRALLNPDGVVAGFFSIISGGSMSGEQSFGVLHAGFVNELFLNRLAKGNVRTIPDAIKMPAKAAVWPAPEGLKTTEGTTVAAKAGFDLVIVRIGFTAQMISTDGSFSPSQLRVMCRKKGDKPRLGGSAVSEYPIGYLKGDNEVNAITMGQRITAALPAASQGPAWMDFVFYVPKDYEPVAVGLKANAFAEVPPMVGANEAPKESSPEPEKPAAPQDANAAQ